MSLEPDALAAGASDALSAPLFAARRHGSVRESAYYAAAVATGGYSPQAMRVDLKQLDSLSIKSAMLDRRRSTLRLPAAAASAAFSAVADACHERQPADAFLVYFEAVAGRCSARRGAQCITQLRLFVLQRLLL